MGAAFSVLAGLGIFTGLMALPLLHWLVLAVNFACHLLVFGLQLSVARFAAKPPRREAAPPEEPFVSIHVPAHNEPPEVLMQTLQSLNRLEWSRYEVLVIDNNTSDPALWEPVREFCAGLGEKFRFFHVEGLKGFKAGAMNYVRRQMDPRAEFIFVVDADYVVEPRALRVAVSYATDERTGLVQFPQNYRNVCAENLGIVLDYRHFFAGFMTVANALGCVVSTGTLALVRVSALENIGGFSTEFVTEDAELGLQLALQGSSAVYVHRRIGAGLMPHELDGLKKQRWRWAFGNAQILRRQWREILFNRRLGWKQKLGFFAHLTAWFNFNLIPCLSLIALALYSLVRPLAPTQIYAVVLSGFTLVSYLFLKYGVLYYSLRPEGHSLREIWKAYTTHVGLGWIFSASWIRCLVNSSSPFVRTNKFLSLSVPGVLRSTVAELSLGAGLLGAAVVFAVADFFLAPIAAALMCAGRLSIYWVAAQTAHTLAATEALFADEAGVAADLMAAEESRAACRS